MVEWGETLGGVEDTPGADGTARLKSVRPDNERGRSGEMAIESTGAARESSSTRQWGELQGGRRGAWCLV